MIEFDVELSSIETELNAQMNEGASGSGTKNYNALSNKPSINNVTLEGNVSSQDLGLLDKNTKIPSKTSELINDSNYISMEQDPTVPSWAKQPDKPTYLPSEIGIVGNTSEEVTEELPLTKLKIGNRVFSVSAGGPTYTNISDSEETF